jgi:hypothetical protein
MTLALTHQALKAIDRDAAAGINISQGAVQSVKPEPEPEPKPKRPSPSQSAEHSQSHVSRSHP